MINLERKNKFLTKQYWENVPFVTWGFLALQIIIYLLMEINGSSQNPWTLHQFGAITHTDITYYHEWWRFITPIFVHIGFEHILLNSITLYFVGMQLESLIGHTRFFIVYLLSGILGNVFSFGFTHANTIAAGASTSLFGIIAAIVVIAYYFRDYPQIRALGSNMVIFILLNLVSNYFSSGVDMLGHIGGIIGGVLMLPLVSFNARLIRNLGAKPFTIPQRIVSGLVYVLVVAISLYAGFH